MIETAETRHRTAGGLDPNGLEDALGRSGCVAFCWTPHDDRVRLSGAAALLGLADIDGGWRGFSAAFAAPDRVSLEHARLTQSGPVVVLARLAGPNSATRRVRVRAAWTTGDAPALTGVIVPAFGAAGESNELEDGGRLGLEMSLRRAVDQLDFEAWYQPVVTLGEERLAGFEALVRWPCPERGLLQPDDFLPMAEELRLIEPIGAWMRAEAAQRIASWREECGSLAPGFVAVNVSTHELESDALAAETAKHIERWKLAPGALKVEVTEGQVMRDPDQAAAQLQALKEAGASLALDDFGAGYSSLSWLERFPFDSIKIDRYFIRTLAASKSSQKIVSSVVDLAHDLGMSVVAEGVESAPACAMLADMGCDYGQGFWFAPALTPVEATQFINAESGPGRSLNG